jgi:predicted PurR-regulated permease PerM
MPTSRTKSSAATSGAAPYRQWLFWAILTVVMVSVAWVLGDILSPFITGMVIAYMLNPIVTGLTLRLKSRALATAVVLIGFVLLVAGFIAVLSPILFKQAGEFIENLPSYMEKLRDWSLPYIASVTNRIEPNYIQQIREAAEGNMSAVLSGGRNIVMRVWSGGMAVVDIVTFLAITPIVAFYCLRDWPKIIKRMDDLLPRKSVDTLRAIFYEFDCRMAGFLRGQMLVCLSLGTFYATGLTLAGLNFGLAIGFISGLLSFIPYVGSVTGFLASVGVALVQFSGWEMPMVIVGIFFLGQFIEGNFLTPKLVGERIGLHAVWVIFALMAGGGLMGFTGLLLAVPVAAMIGVVVRYAVMWYQKSPAYLDV